MINEQVDQVVDQLFKSKEDYKGIGEVSDAYATVPPVNFRNFFIVGRDDIDTLIDRLNEIKEILPKNKNGDSDFFLGVNNEDPFYMDESMKNNIIKQLQSSINTLQSASENIFEDSYNQLKTLKDNVV